ncbi:MAG: hypothetical protein Q9182_004258 [Xanthomendoza sp. 2 TL-2023]
MERAKRAAHVVVANSSNETNPPPSSSSSSSNTPPTDITTNATAASQSLGKDWSVEKVLTLIPHPPPTTPTSPLPFLHTIARLKTTPREGWRRFSIPSPESISDHMYRMSILTLLCPHPLATRLNLPHCTLLALCHDMAECLVGDLTPLDGIPKPEKHRREAETMTYLTRTLLGPSTGCPATAGDTIRAAWEEYETNATAEAQFVHDLDKLELLLQMVEYERQGQGAVDLSEFVRVAAGIETAEMKAWGEEVLRERDAFWENEVGRDVPEPKDDARGHDHIE